MILVAISIAAIVCVYAFLAYAVRKWVVHSHRGLLYILLSLFFFLSVFTASYYLAGNAP